MDNCLVHASQPRASRALPRRETACAETISVPQSKSRTTDVPANTNTAWQERPLALCQRPSNRGSPRRTRTYNPYRLTEVSSHCIALTKHVARRSWQCHSIPPLPIYLRGASRLDSVSAILISTKIALDDPQAGLS